MRRVHHKRILTLLKHVLQLTQLVFLVQQINLIVVVLHELEFFFLPSYTLAYSLAIVKPLLFCGSDSFVLEVDCVDCVSPRAFLTVYTLCSTRAIASVDLRQSVKIDHIEQFNG